MDFLICLDLWFFIDATYTFDATSQKVAGSIPDGITGIFY